MRYITFSIFILLLASCEKNKLAQKEETDPSGSAMVKIGWFSQTFAGNNVGVQVKFDGVRNGSPFTSPTPYPGGGFNTGGNSFADYLAVTAGQRTMTISVPKVGTEVDSIVRFNGAVTVAPDVRQTIMLTDTGANLQATVLTDLISPPETPGNFARAKFFNGMPGTTLDLYIRSSSGTLAGPKNVAYKGVSSYFDFPAGLSNDTLDVVNAGSPYASTTVPLARYVWTQANIIPGRVYTMLSAGYPTIPYTSPTTENRRARVSVVLNR